MCHTNLKLEIWFMNLSFISLSKHLWTRQVLQTLNNQTSGHKCLCTNVHLFWAISGCNKQDTELMSSLMQYFLLSYFPFSSFLCCCCFFSLDLHPNSLVSLSTNKIRPQLLSFWKISAGQSRRTDETQQHSKQCELCVSPNSISKLCVFSLVFWEGRLSSYCSCGPVMSVSEGEGKTQNIPVLALLTRFSNHNICQWYSLQAIMVTVQKHWLISQLPFYSWWWWWWFLLV